MKSVKTHTFNGTKYVIYIDENKLDGYCLNDPREPYEIAVCVPLNTQKGLETAIHEATHAIRPRMSEADVDKFGKDMARWLWRLGYRHV